MPTGITPWNETFRIRSYEVEPNGRASVQAMCQFLQEGASNHAKALGFSMENLVDRNLTWVLSRLHAEIDSYPIWRDDVTLTTWPSRQGGLLATREFLLHDGDGGELLRATSAWLLIDLARRRPVRLPDYILELLIPNRIRALKDSFPKMRVPEVNEFEHRFEVRWSDLDLNGHVNNVRYVEWVVESIPPAFKGGRQLSAMEVNFRAETGFGSTVVAYAGPANSPNPEEMVLGHRLRLEENGREIAIARTRWRPSSD